MTILTIAKAENWNKYYKINMIKYFYFFTFSSLEMFLSIEMGIIIRRTMETFIIMSRGSVKMSGGLSLCVR